MEGRKKDGRGPTVLLWGGEGKKRDREREGLTMVLPTTDSFRHLYITYIGYIRKDGQVFPCDCVYKGLMQRTVFRRPFCLSVRQTHAL